MPVATNNLTRSPLLLELSELPAPSKNAFFGGRKQRRRDILIKWKKIPTSEGTKKQGFGDRATGKKIRMVPRGSGELLTPEKPPATIEKVRRLSAHSKRAQRRQRLAASALQRQPLLLDHHGEST